MRAGDMCFCTWRRHRIERTVGASAKSRQAHISACHNIRLAAVLGDCMLWLNEKLLVPDAVGLVWHQLPLHKLHPCTQNLKNRKPKTLDPRS